MHFSKQTFQTLNRAQPLCQPIIWHADFDQLLVDRILSIQQRLLSQQRLIKSPHSSKTQPVRSRNRALQECVYKTTLMHSTVGTLAVLLFA